MISIIAILIALLLPALAAARQDAEVTMCASNERQIMLAIQDYANENNGALVYDTSSAFPRFTYNYLWDAQLGGESPQMWNWNTSTQYARPVESYLAGYPANWLQVTPASAVWQCPLFVTQGRSYVFPPPHNIRALNSTSYALNANLDLDCEVSASGAIKWRNPAAPWYASPVGGPFSINSIPLDEAVLADCSYAYGYPDVPPIPAADTVNGDYTNKSYPSYPPWQVNSYIHPIPGPTPGPASTLGNIPLHGGVINTAFADGHVESINSMQTFAQAIQPKNVLW